MPAQPAVCLQTDELRGLAAHLEDGDDLRVQSGEPAGDGLELVLQRRLQRVADEPAAGTRQAQTLDGLARHGRQQVVEQGTRRVARAPLEASVAGDQHWTTADLRQAARWHEEEIGMIVGEAGEQVAVAGLAHERRLEADAADIYAEANHAALKPCLSETAKRRPYRLVCGLPPRKASGRPPQPSPYRRKKTIIVRDGGQPFRVSNVPRHGCPSSSGKRVGAPVCRSAPALLSSHGLRRGHG